MLTACAASGPKALPADAPAANPVIEVREVVVRECPAALATVPQAQPAPKPDAVVEYNTAGGQWLADVLAWAAAGWAVVRDAAADCPEVAPD